jgi:hypothetical protein
MAIGRRNWVFDAGQALELSIKVGERAPLRLFGPKQAKVKP